MSASVQEPAGGDETVALRARVAALEAESRRAFGEAQREADALFAQYQLSQLIASGGTTAELAAAVLLELGRLAGADGGAVWLGGSEGGDLVLAATSGELTEPPARVPDVAAIRAWAADRPDLQLVVVTDDPAPVAVVLRPPPERTLDEDGVRVAQLVRHELAVAFAGARLREALERESGELAAIVDGATDLIVQVDEAGRVVRLNPAGEQLLGQPAAVALGRPCGEVLGCEAAGGHRLADCPLAATIRTGQPIGYLETAVKGPAGPIAVAGGYSVNASSPGGTRATAILRDVTAARALDQLREGFVATVSHELRTPIALVRGYAETLLHLELEADQQRTYVERIHGLTSRLGDLVTQILDITHLDADPLILERAPIAFSALVARLRGDLALSGADARLVVELSPDLPPIEVDGGRIGRVLENLVGNALKYAPDGSPITLGAEVDREWLVAHVDDEGIGIPEEDRPLVTEPFHRAWNVRESRIAGTGLGLYICRRLVEAHGGTLAVLDRPDGRPGTRVSFRLPLLPDRRRRGAPAGRLAAGTAPSVPTSAPAPAPASVASDG